MKLSQYNYVREQKDGVLLFNTNNKGLLRLDSEFAAKYRELETGRIDSLDDFTGALFANGFIVDDDIDEFEALLVKNLCLRYNESRAQVTIAPTTGCNFACPYCYEAGLAALTMSGEHAAAVARFVSEEFGKAKVLMVNWYGGEPLLCLDRIAQLTELIRGALPPECKYEASIVTNGYHLTERAVKVLCDCGVREAQVTIDGAERPHDLRRIPSNGEPTYERILHNIKSAVDDIGITIRVNVDADNSADLDGLLIDIDRMALAGKVDIYLAMVDDALGDDGHSSTRYLDAKAFSTVESLFYRSAIELGFDVGLFRGSEPGICSAIALGSAVIDPEGSLCKCWDEMGCSDKSYGTVDAPRFSSLNSSRWLRYVPGQEGKCHHCVYFPLCWGGCPREALEGRKDMCGPIKYNLDDKIDLLALQSARSRETSAGGCP